jgi:hypothetical protein
MDRLAYKLYARESDYLLAIPATSSYGVPSFLPDLTIPSS